MNQQDNRDNTGRSDVSRDGMLPSEAERRLREDAGAVVETAKEGLGGIKAEAETEIGALAEEGKRQAGELAQKAKGFAAEQKDMLAGQLGGVAQAIHKAADELDQENATTAGYAHRIAEGMDRITTSLREQDVDGLIAMAEDFGRRQPAAFMATAAIAGFAASRFLRASAGRRSGAARPDGTRSYPEARSDYGSATPAGVSDIGSATPDGVSGIRGDTIGRPYQ